MNDVRIELKNLSSTIYRALRLTQLVDDVGVAWHELIRSFERNPEELYKVDPRKLEELIAGAYKLHGYEVALTPRSGDRGRDVVATKHGVGSVRIFDQIKRYKISRPVSADEVRAARHNNSSRKRFKGSDHNDVKLCSPTPGR